MDAGKTGTYLAALRRERGMTQQDAAQLLHLSNKTVSKWESGGGLPDITVLPALAELYSVTADDILAGETLKQDAASFRPPRSAVNISCRKRGSGSISSRCFLWYWLF